MLSLNIFIACFLTYATYVHCQNTCEAFIDLTLLIDSSGSISPPDFEKAKEALLDLVSRLNVEPEKAGVSIINFASTFSVSGIQNVFEFERMKLLEEVAALPHLSTNTATGEALTLASQYCQYGCRDITKGVPRIFAVFTDGHSNEGRPPIPVAEALRGSPIEGTVFAVGIGNIGPDGDAELLGMAGDKDYVMNIDSYLELARVINAITTKICEFPAFVGPDVKVQGEMTGNSTRYYKMHTLKSVKKNAFFEIEINDRAGKTTVYTSTTNKKPSPYNTKSISTRGTGSSNKFTTYVPATADSFYFSVRGVETDLNQYDFTVRVRPLNF